MIEQLFKLLGSLLLPPASLLILMLIGWRMLPRAPRLARCLLVGSPIALTLLSLPMVSSRLIICLQPYPALDIQRLPPAQAIVVLCGGVNEYGEEYGGTTTNRFSLERARYAAYLHRASHLPVLVTGGSPGRPGKISEAAVMAKVLQHEFATPVRWVEDQAYNTAENASQSAALLHQAKVREILLVTTAWHMPRAMASFQPTGLIAHPAPTAFTKPPKQLLATDFVPSAPALMDSYYALHEWIGMGWYGLRHMIQKR
ncbi:uncharacterized SAM-binding protein YcdF (DUF218 family) [Chitinivorax tropicus]|uniref:Uncharacterized SAM-binding protein YcdF (DUF218 family) n=1 Tax=Chitinivorax tropicus TaxID=714531 RepID=A0A840MXH0_9PROT|nr:YdcF family protein [Chitinivorax tropicus]MBB5019851.1 uncharacterized SAM-binding protein YcdF (DUF218 family) [Chitinivorax tropicus]